TITSDCDVTISYEIHTDGATYEFTLYNFGTNTTGYVKWDLGNGNIQEGETITNTFEYGSHTIRGVYLFNNGLDSCEDEISIYIPNECDYFNVNADVQSGRKVKF